MALMIFDLDETLISADSCSLFCQYLAAENIVDESFITKDNAMMARYHAGTLDMTSYVQFLVGSLKHLSIAELEALMPGYIEQMVTPHIYPQAQALLAALHNRQDRPLIISASPEFIVRHIANALGVQDFLAINLAQENGHYSGEITGVPTFQAGKVTRLNAWAQAHEVTLEGACFYSDSSNDLPLLEQVDHPIATNPDSHLLAIAKSRNWPVLNWNKQPNHTQP